MLKLCHKADNLYKYFKHLNKYNAYMSVGTIKYKKSLLPKVFYDKY